MANKNKQLYSCDPGFTPIQVGEGIVDFLQDEKGMVAQGFSSSDGYFIQAKTEGTLKNMVGAGKAIQVQVSGGAGTIEVQIGSGKWSDKVGAGAVGMMFFAPLAVTAAIGTIGQSQLPNEIFAYVERYFIVSLPEPSISSLSSEQHLITESPSTAPQNGGSFCTNCGTQIPSGSKFCPGCGSSQSTSNCCPSCGTELQPDQRFCHNCGTDTQG